ncbi:tellurite resistance TerB family protein [Marivita sp.]|uniref:tellurite resistance TerB family protein n=1 Tax=Marivita sp. TaxID=2003365 RepID=UPI003F6C8332
MSLMGTLAKVAIGYATARGVDQLAGGKGLGGLMGGAQVEGDNPMAQIQAQLGKMMGGGGENPLAGMMDKLQSGGLDLSSMMGGAAGSQDSGDKGGLLSQLGGGGGAGLAGILAAAGGMAAMGGKNMGGMLDQFANSGAAAPEAEETAALMLRAMIQAAKCDGGIDDAERAKIIDTVGDDADAEDIAYVQEQLAAPVDVAALAADTPAPLRTQVYSASLMAIRLDTQPEAQYLDALARAMELDQPTVNGLHMQMGVQPLYS